VTTPTTVAPPADCMLDASGRYVPSALVKAEHKLEDELVREMHAEALQQSAAIRAFKDASFEKVDTLLALLDEKHGAKPGGAKGNLTLSSYDGSLRVQVAVGNQVEFGPELQAAKTLIDACIEEWAASSGPELRVLVNDAFDVGKEGKLRTDRILGLRRLEITKPEWIKAMAAIGDAVRVVSSRRYVRFYQRAKAGGTFDQVQLDIARA